MLEALTLEGAIARITVPRRVLKKAPEEGPLPLTNPRAPCP